MNIFFGEDLISTVRSALDCNRNLAIREILRQSRRIFSLYMAQPPKHAKYWSKVDSAALFALAQNRQIPRHILNVACVDLEAAEKSLVALDPQSVEVYNDFVYFIEHVSRPAANKTELLDRVKEFVERYSNEQLMTLCSFAKLDTGMEELNASLKDAVRRIRSNVNTKVKGAFVQRLALVVEFVQDVLKKRQNEPEKPTEPTKPTTNDESKQEQTVAQQVPEQTQQQAQAQVSERMPERMLEQKEDTKHEQTPQQVNNEKKKTERKQKRAQKSKDKKVRIDDKKVTIGK